VPEPWASRLVLEGGGKVLVDEKDLWPDGAFVTTHLIVSTEYLKKYPGTITKLLAAEADTLDTVTKDPAKAKETANAALLALTTKQLKPEVLDRAWENLTLTLDPVASTLQVSADHGVEVGTTQKADLKGIYDLSLLNALLKARGAAAVSAAGLGTE
jgi:NitT/TauT family transport system substrate-binding protein